MVAKMDNYWTKRINDIMDLLDTRDEKLNAAMLKEYKAASDDISKRIADFYDKYAEDGTLNYEDARKQIRSTDLSDYVKRANEYREASDKNPEMLRRLNAQYTTARLNRLELLKLEIDFRLIQASDKQDKSFTDYLSKESSYIYDQLVNGKTIDTLNDKEIETIIQNEWSGANYSQRLWRDNDLLANKLKDELVRAAINGSNPKVTAKKLRDSFGGTKPNTERLVRTESTYVANATIAKRYNDMGVKSYTFSAHIDSRTSSICRHLNGETFPLKDFKPGVNAPAMHPNCRSRIVPSDDDLSKFDKYLDD